MVDYTALYNRTGKSIAWISENSYPTIYLFSGEPVAWISEIQYITF